MATITLPPHRSSTPSRTTVERSTWPIFTATGMQVTAVVDHR